MIGVSTSKNAGKHHTTDTILKQNIDLTVVFFVSITFFLFFVIIIIVQDSHHVIQAKQLSIIIMIITPINARKWNQ